MTKVEQARDIYEAASDNTTRGDIIVSIMVATTSGKAYASTLYNKARKLSWGEPTKSGNKEAFADLGNKLGITDVVVDAVKAKFIKNCWKIQGLKSGHYNHTFELDGEYLTAVGINKTNELMVVKTGTKTRVKVSTKRAMNILHKIKFLGKK